VPAYPLESAFASGFGLLARLRRDRALHPDGAVWTVRTTFVRPIPGVPAIADRAPIDGLLRLSRAVGLPRSWPDILGWALRLHDLHGPGRHQDLLLASSPPPPLHTALWPRRSFATAWFTGLLPYRIGDERTVLVTRAAAPDRFALGTADPGRRRVAPLADVVLTTRREPAPPEAASFDPIRHAAPAFRQDAGRLDAIRARAYAASRANRPPR